MPTTRKRKTRKKQLDPELFSFFAYLGGANRLKKKHGERYLKRQWALYGRDLLNNWPYEKPPLILKVYGEPETCNDTGHL